MCDSVSCVLVRSAMPSDVRTRRQQWKPLMERRRRARINSSLAQLHTLLLHNAPPRCRRPRLEKADILEMTVQHLQTRRSADPTHTGPCDPAAMARFRSGFARCVEEAAQFLSDSDAGDLGGALLQRLTTSLSAMEGAALTANPQHCHFIHTSCTLPAHPNRPTTDVGQSLPGPSSSARLQLLTEAQASPQGAEVKAALRTCALGRGDVWRPW
ncbi:HES1B factor, partial [Amia calva]|nr:HES1B factor [Amia calva]